MIKKNKKIIILIGLTLILIIPLIIFHARPPVLIVTEDSFIPLYGEDRIRREIMISSIRLFRTVYPVVVANDAGYDIVPLAIAEVSTKPYCVLFPLRFVRAARLYRQANPGIPIILLEGRQNAVDSLYSIGANPDEYFIYGSDIENDFYRAGMAAAAINIDENRAIAVFLQNNIETQAREVFLRAANSRQPVPETLFFSYFSQFSQVPELSCVVLAGTGIEYFDRNEGIPVIFFTWLHPTVLPNDVFLIINDSPWIQTVQAVRMAKSGMKQGRIQSKFQIINNENIDRKTLSILKNRAKM
jgi:hypothetical protein